MDKDNTPGFSPLYCQLPSPVSIPRMDCLVKVPWILLFGLWRTFFAARWGLVQGERRGVCAGLMLLFKLRASGRYQPLSKSVRVKVC